jgi:hypothetical protein
VTPHSPCRRASPGVRLPDQDVKLWADMHQISQTRYPPKGVDINPLLALVDMSKPH